MKLSNDQTKLLGQYLADCRRAANKSQGHMAKALGYTSNQYISNVERGLCEPNPAFLRVAMKVYKIPKASLAKVLLDTYRAQIKEVLE